jgi:hypothetical protein
VVNGRGHGGKGQLGRDAEKAVHGLDETKPKGGQGGECGQYGMDNTVNKKNFFTKSKREPLVVNRAELLKDYLEYASQIANGENISKTNSNAIFDFSVLGFGLVGALMGMESGALIGSSMKRKIPVNYNPYRLRDLSVPISSISRQLECPEICHFRQLVFCVKFCQFRQYCSLNSD